MACVIIMRTQSKYVKHILYRKCMLVICKGSINVHSLCWLLLPKMSVENMACQNSNVQYCMCLDLAGTDVRAQNSVSSRKRPQVKCEVYIYMQAVYDTVCCTQTGRVGKVSACRENASGRCAAEETFHLRASQTGGGARSTTGQEATWRAARRCCYAPLGPLSADKASSLSRWPGAYRGRLLRRVGTGNYRHTIGAMTKAWGCCLACYILLLLTVSSLPVSLAGRTIHDIELETKPRQLFSCTLTMNVFTLHN